MPKRTNAIKRTDVKSNKPWLKKINASIYNIETLDTNKLVLITCEGQTEKLYFEAFPVLTLTVKSVDLKGESKLKLIESTSDIVKNSETQYDEIWCVFDMDFKSGEKEFADFDNAVEKGKALGFNIAYSNDSFELWLYLHYQYTEQQNNRTFYYNFLSKQWDMNYEKDGKKYIFCLSLYNKLSQDINASQEKAIERARKLHINQDSTIYHKQNPITIIYKLVELLNANCRK